MKIGDKYKIHCYKHNGEAYQASEETIILDIKDEYIVCGNYMVDVKPDSAYAVNITETFSGDKKEVETLKTQTIFQYNGNWYIK